MNAVFGPVPSRRLGRSLGINNIPPKACPYCCVYCQIGPTRTREVTPRAFYPPREVVRQVTGATVEQRRRGERIDYLTFVPDGEPCLDMGLGGEIDQLRPLGVPIAVISNASLVWQPAVAAALRRADWVSVKVDTVDEKTWRRLNRPHRTLQLGKVLEGIRRFSAEFRGCLVSETMLVAGYNDADDQVEATGRFLAEVGVDTAYLAVPLRPPAVATALPPPAAVVTRAHQIMAQLVPKVELLTTPEDDTFAASGEPGEDILAICAVHPMREAAVRSLLAATGAPWSVIERLVSAGLLQAVPYRDETFYVRSFAGR